MLEMILAVIIGIIAGTITGLIPGLHINLVSLLLFVSAGFFLEFTTPIILGIFIITMAITHSFLDFLPSIFLGAPDEATALSVLPGHRFLLKGQGYGAIKLTTIGCFLGVIIAFIITPLFIFLSPHFYPYLNKIIPFLLIFISILLIIKENKKIPALFIFLFSGILGYLSLNLTIIKQPLFPLFTGLFGSSLLTISFIQNVKIPKQKIKKINIKKTETVTGILSSIFSSSLVSFVPGIGASQAAAISASIKKMNEKTFLLLLGIINTMVMILSFVSLYSINKPRTGVAVFVGKLLPSFSNSNLWTFLIIALIVAIIALFLTLFFAKIFSKNISKIKYKWLCLGILIFLFILTPIISGPASLLILIAGTSLGILTSVLGIRKIHMMGALILPVILFYFL